MSRKIVQHDSTKLFGYVSTMSIAGSKTTDITTKLHLDHIWIDTVECELVV